VFDLTELQCLGDIPRVQAQRQPDGTAQIFDGRRTTFAEFDRRTNRAARALLEAGLEPQSRVGYLGKNSDRYFELLFGAFKSNTVVVGVNWRLAAPEIEYILRDADCRALFVGAEYYAIAAEVAARCPRISTVVAMDGAHRQWPAFDGWLDACRPDDLTLAIAADDDAVQLYTSGTTGHPKGVQLTNANFFALFGATEAAQWGSFEAGDAALACMPVFHIAGVNMGVLSIAQGATNVVMKEVDPGLIVDFIPRYQINYVFFVPAVMLFISQLPDVRDADFSSLKKLFYGASPITEDLLQTARDIFGCDFYQLYGLTETTGSGTFLPPTDHAGARLRSCGKSYPGIAIKIVGVDGKALAPGEVGEIAIRHAAVMKGYWNRPEATAEAIIDGWFHTGDAGYVDEDGYFYIHDRIKDMIVSGGENIYPAEVENALSGHAAIADVAVIGVPDERWGEVVKAVVVLKPRAKASADDIIAYTRTRIAGFKLPKSIDFVDELPRNPSGKVLRRELRAQYWKGKERNVN
jgi:acyl-CoA synthetase (AMP-forming)/AMP-acid ligase II